MLTQLDQHEHLCTMMPSTRTTPSLLTTMLVLSMGHLFASPSLTFAQTPATATPQPQAKNVGQNRYGMGLGRLLTSERERTKIDDLRFNVVEQAKAAKEEAVAIEEAPQLLHIDGITQRPDRPVGQRISVWINGRVYAEDALPYGLSVARNARGEVTGLNSVVSKGKTEFAKIGDDITRPQTAAEAQAIELAAIQSKKPAVQP
jgi:hypothetical protein